MYVVSKIILPGIIVPSCVELVQKEYCKTLIIRVTLFSGGNRSGYSREILFSQFVISCSIILTPQSFGEDFIFASLYYPYIFQDISYESKTLPTKNG